MKCFQFVLTIALAAVQLFSIAILGACNTAPTTLKGKLSQNIHEQVENQWQKNMPKIEFFKFDSLYILSGENVTLRWKISQADNVTIKNSLGTVGPSSGSLGQVELEGSRQFVFPRAGRSNLTEYVYTLTASNSYGSVAGNAKVMVEDEDQPPGIYLQVSPARIKPGMGARLEWNVSFADEVKMDDGSGNYTAVEPMGEKIVYPQKTAAYTITAVNKAGKSIKSIVIEVVIVDN